MFCCLQMTLIQYFVLTFSWISKTFVFLHQPLSFSKSQVIKLKTDDWSHANCRHGKSRNWTFKEENSHFNIFLYHICPFLAHLVYFFPFNFEPSLLGAIHFLQNMGEADPLRPWSAKVKKICLPPLSEKVRFNHNFDGDAMFDFLICDTIQQSRNRFFYEYSELIKLQCSESVSQAAVSK